MQEDIRGIINLNKYDFVIKWRLTNCCNYRCSYCIRKNKVESIDKIYEDTTKINYSLPLVVDIIKNRKVDTKLELIGGEISLFNLESFISKLCKETKPYLKRITFTSNFSKPVEYYNNLIDLCYSLDVSLGMIYSFHPEYVSLDNFIHKFNEIKKYKENRISVEMVSTHYNKRLVNDFIKQCKENNIEYKVDADFNDPNKSELITTSNKDNTEGFRIDFNNYSEYCDSLRKLEQIYGDSQKIATKGFMCTLDYDYIYIDKDKHIGYDETTKNCKTEMDLKDFRVRDFDNLIVCNRNCTLCGKMSVFMDKTLYNKEKK